MADRIGQRLGNYRLTRLLGRGGFAEVYLGEHLDLLTLVAIKILHTRVAESDMAQFRQEARLLASLKHPHIVRVLDYGVSEETPYLVMDYAPNGTLRTRHTRGMQLPVSTTVSYVKQIAEALQYAHSRKVIHRDIKPENMLIGERDEILLSDFGIALIAQSSHYQSTKDMAGTIAYMAPEQISAHPRRESDQYALAIVIYEWLSGALPFQGSLAEIAIKHSVTPPTPLREHLPLLSSEIDQVIMTALAKKPEERFATVSAFANAFEQASRTEQRHFAPLPSPPPPPASVDPLPALTAETSSYKAPPDLPAPEKAESPFRISRRTVLIGSASLATIVVIGTGTLIIARQIMEPSSQTGTSQEPTPSQTVEKATCVSGTLQVTGSTALQPLVQDVANEYQKQCTGAKITVGGGGSGTGVQNVFDGSSGVGNSDIYGDATKYPGLVDHQVAVAVFSVVINEKVTGITNLTSAQMKDIYTGVAISWKAFGGPDLAIVPVSRPAGSGTRVTFEQYVLGTKESFPPGSTNPSAGSSGEVATSIQGTDGAVSYVFTDFAKKNGLKVVKLDGAEDSDANVKDNTYKFWNVEHMYTKGQPTELAKALIDYVWSPATASIRQKLGFLDITTMTKAALDAKDPKS